MKLHLPVILLICLVSIVSLIYGCTSTTSSLLIQTTPTTTVSSATLQPTAPTSADPITISNTGMEGISVIIEPCRDDPEVDIGFVNLTVTKGFLDRDYNSLYVSPELAKKGVPCLSISGNITNKSGKRYWVIYFARGYDKPGNQVSWSLDAGPILGVAQLSFEQTKIEGFVLHQSWADNVTTFRIYSQKSAMMFP